jgi:hypothetical protein
MEGFFERLESLVNRHAEGKYQKFAKLCDIPPSTFYKYKKDRTPQAEYLCSIHKAIGVNINWLLTGEGDAYSVDKGAVSGENPIILIGDIIEGLETVLQEDDSELPPRTMRLVVEQIYKRCRKTGEAVTEDIVRDYLKLVAA